MKKSKFISNRPGQLSFGLTRPEEEMYSFENFFAGERNRLALSAAESFRSGGSPRVLVVTGPSQSGKSHLLKGIFAGNPGRPGAALVSGAALAEAAEEEARAALRALAGGSLALIDDLHLLKGRGGLLDEVFHLFNALSAADGRLAVTMDESPARSPYLPDYLSSRLLTGMVVSLDRPDEEERLMILGKLASDMNISLTPRALMYVLSRSGRSVASMREFLRELEESIGPGRKRIGLQLLRRVIESKQDEEKA